MRSMFGICVSALVICTAVEAQCEEKTHELRASPSTVHTSFFDASLKPVLTINSGDIVRLWTTTGNPKYFESLGVPKEKIPAELFAAFEGAPGAGRGDHTLDGPIAVRGAEIGDTVEIKIRSIELWLPIAAMSFRANRGTLPEDFPYSRDKVLFFDPAKKAIPFAPGVVVPAKPFWGVIAWRRRPPWAGCRADRPTSSAATSTITISGAGTSLYLPVHAPGALLSIGDGHAAQGDGEVGLSAVETSLRGRNPGRAAQGDLHVLAAGRNADPLHDHRSERRPQSGRQDGDPRDARLHRRHQGIVARRCLDGVSAAMDLQVTEIVDGTKGVHAMLPKSIFQR